MMEKLDKDQARVDMLPLVSCFSTQGVFIMKRFKVFIKGYKIQE